MTFENEFALEKRQNFLLITIFFFFYWSYLASYRWMTKTWSECDQKCGLGKQRRVVYCGLSTKSNEKSNQTDELDEIRMDDAFCSGNRPLAYKSCHATNCPKWIHQEWSEVSLKLISITVGRAKLIYQTHVAFNCRLFFRFLF